MMVLIEQREQVQVDHIPLIRCSSGGLLEGQMVAEILQMSTSVRPTSLLRRRPAHSHSFGSWTKLILLDRNKQLRQEVLPH